MADDNINKRPTLGPHQAYDDVAAGLNLTDDVAPNDIEPPAVADARQTQVAGVEALNAQEVTAWRLAKDIAKETLTGSMWLKLTTPEAEPDESFTIERLEGRLQEAAKVLPPDWLETLSDAHSDAHFDLLVKRAQSHLDSIKRIQEAGMPVQIAAVLSHMVDPATLAIALPVGGLAMAGTRAGLAMTGLAAAGGRVGSVAAGAVGGVAGAIAPELVRQEQGVPVSDEDLLWIGGFGLVLGSAFGALANNPAVADVAAQMGRTGRKLMTQAEQTKVGKAALDATRQAMSKVSQKSVKEASQQAAPQGFAEIGNAGQAISQNMRSMLWKKVEEGAIEENGQPTAVLQAAKLARDYGGLRDQAEFDAFLDDYGKIQRGPNFQQEMRELVELHSRLIPNADGSVTLYRGENPDGASAEGRFKGRFFTTDEAEARAYAGEKGMVKEIRVPRERVKELLPRKDASGKVHPHEQNYAVPEDLAGQAVPRDLPYDAVKIQKAVDDFDNQLTELQMAAQAADELPAIPGDLPAAISHLDDFTLPGSADDAARVAQRLSKLEDLAEDLKNGRYIGRYGLGDDEYRVMAQTADMSGPYAVQKKDGSGKYSILTRNLESLQEAQEAILKEAPDLADPSALSRQARIREDEGGRLTQAHADREFNVTGLQEILDGNVEPPPARPSVTSELPDGRQVTIEPVGNRFAVTLSDAPTQTMTREELVGLYQKMLMGMARQTDDSLIEASLMAEQAKAQAAGAQAAPTIPQLLQDPDWRAVLQEDVPQWTGFWRGRYDRAGLAATSQSPITRLIGPAFMNDTVGRPNHSLNQFPAILDTYRISKQYGNAFYQTYNPALQEYIREAGAQLNPVERFRLRREFNREVGRAVRSIVTEADALENVPDSVRRVAHEMSRLQNEALKDMQNPLRREGLQGRPLEGAADTADNFAYLWRKVDGRKFVTSVRQVGEEGMERLVAGAIRSAQPDIEPGLLQRLTRAYVRGTYRRETGVDDAWSTAIGEGNYRKFRDLLTKDGDGILSEDDINNIIDRMNVHRPQPGMENLKRRILLDENYVEENIPLRDGTGVVTLGFQDLLEQDAELLFNRYMRRVAGRVALARVRVAHPRGGPLLIDGVTSDYEFEQILGRIRAWYGDRDLDKNLAKRDIDNLQFVYDRIKGVPDPKQVTETATWLRRVRSYMSARLMGMVGIAQIGETAQPVATLGVRAAFAHVPGFRRIIDHAGRSTLRDPLFAELEAIGIGGERLHGFTFNTIDEIGDFPFEVNRFQNPTLHYADETMRTMERSVYELSGMSFIQQQQQRAVGAAMAQRIANINPQRIGRGNQRRLAQLGIDEPMLQRILQQMDQHIDTTESIFFGNKIRRLNLHNWDDLEARAHLEDALFRAANKLIQTNDPTNAALWMSNPIYQTIFQFRSFTLTAYANQFLYNIHMGDPAAVAAFVWSTAWNAAVRAAQVKIVSLGRSDADRYTDKYLSTHELAKAGFQRSGWSSIIPMVVDTLNTVTGGEGVFDARTTGQPTDVIFGSPAGSAVQQLARGARGLREAVTQGRSPSQAEARALYGLLPYQNLFPISTALSHMISGLPERTPPRKRNY